MIKENSAELTKLEEKLAQILKNSKFQPKPDTILINLEAAAHNLSKEEQIYFRNTTESIFGYSEQVRNETLKQLAVDYHVKLIVPYLCNFIRDTIHCNLVFTDLTLLIYAVRMIKSLLANPHINMKPYIHEILPAVLSCALARKISKYYSDNHWTLRDFSAFIVARICQMYSDNLNNMKKRLVDIYIKGITDMNHGLATTYGAIKGLSSIGEMEVKNHLIPSIMLISDKIHKVLEMNNYGFHMEYQKQQISEAKHVRNIMVTICAPILYKMRNINDGGISYVTEFGYLGKSLYIQVKNIESMEQAKTQQAQYMQQISNFFHATTTTSVTSSIANQNNSTISPINANVSHIMGALSTLNTINNINPMPNVNSNSTRLTLCPSSWFHIGL